MIVLSAAEPSAARLVNVASSGCLPSSVDWRLVTALLLSLASEAARKPLPVCSIGFAIIQLPPMSLGEKALRAQHGYAL